LIFSAPDQAEITAPEYNQRRHCSRRLFTAWKRKFFGQIMVGSHTIRAYNLKAASTIRLTICYAVLEIVIGDRLCSGPMIATCLDVNRP
jgi:hypothetical protein